MTGRSMGADTAKARPLASQGRASAFVETRQLPINALSRTSHHPLMGAYDRDGHNWPTPVATDRRA